MENLRFRAWDKEDNRMKEVFNLDFHRYTAIVGFRLSEPKSFLGDNPLIIMQSTGLKDKNGVEIFEGDIISCEIETIEKFIICEQCGCFGIRDEIDGFISLNSINETLSIHKEFEVIGNKYEHPHLLKE